MKRKMFAMALMMLMVACNKPQPIPGPTPTPTPTPESSVVFETGTETKPVLAVEGGKIYLKFNATGAWTASVINTKADEWITLDKTKGEAGTATITVTVLQNDTPDERNATVEIKCGTSTASAVVTQKQKDALTVTAAKNEIEAAGGTFSIEVKANIEFTYQIAESCKDWLTYTETKALKTSTLNFTVAANPGTAKREGSVTVKSSLGEEVIKVYQAGEGPAIILTKNDYAVKAEGETITVEVKSNVDVTVAIGDSAKDWIKASATKAMSTNTYCFDIAANGSYESRTGDITFTNTDSGLSEKVTVTQMQKDALVVAQSSYSVASSGGSIEIELGHNVDFDIAIADSWVSNAGTKAYVTDKLVFTVAANDTYESRETSITFTSKDKAITQTVKVVQAQMDAIVVAPATYTAKPAGETLALKLGHNVEYSVAIDCDWITDASTKAFTEQTLNFTVARNATEASRTGKITFKSKDNAITQTVTVTQASLTVRHIKSITKKYSFVANENLTKIANISVAYADAGNQVVKQTVSGNSWSTSVTVYASTKSTNPQIWKVNNSVGALSITCNPRYDIVAETDVYDIDYAVNVVYEVEYTDGQTSRISSVNIAPEMPEQEGKFIAEEVNAVSLSCTVDNELVINDVGDVAVEEVEFWEEPENEGYEPPVEQMGEEQVPPTTVPEPVFPPEPEPEVEPVIEYPERDYVDLGYAVNGKQALWATCNVGARTEGDFGGLYGWGDASGYHCEANPAFYPSRNPEDVVTDGSGSISGTRADIARAQWGPKWRMPSKAEWEALVQNCTYARKQVDGNWGYEFTSKHNGNHIFLPAADERYVENLYRASKDPKNYYGMYWAGEWVATDAQLAYYFYFQPGPDTVYPTCQGNKDRYYGHSVRAIRVEP